MTVSQPVKRVVDLLKAAGYRERLAPITVASVPFEFDSLLLGADRALDLIVVMDTLTEPEPRLRQKIEGLSRALDLVASRRPLTVILVGPPPRAPVFEALAKVCRVLTVGTPTGDGAEQQLTDALAVLLPLALPDANQTVVDPLAEVGRRLGEDQPFEDASALLAAAPQGTEAVTDVLRAFLQQPFGAP